MDQIAVARDEYRAVTVQIRRCKRGVHVFREHYMAKQRLSSRSKARLDIEHLDQSPRDTRCVDPFTRRGHRGFGHEAQASRLLLLENVDSLGGEMRRIDDHR